jgi:hypothetical protein
VPLNSDVRGNHLATVLAGNFMRSPSSNVRGLLATILAAIIGGALVFLTIPLVVLELASMWAKYRSAADPSFGDGLGWGLVIASPILLAIDLGVSVGVAVVIYSRVRDRLVLNDDANL